MPALPIGLLEWNPAAGTKKVFPLNSNGSGDSDTNANYHTYRWNSLDTVSLSGTEWQVASYWDVNENLVISVRSNGGTWTHYVYDGVAQTPTIARSEFDNHNNCNIALDSSGYIHISYDHHNVALNYRRSTVAVNSFTGTLTANLSMLGTNEDSVSYPTFYKDPLGVLYFAHRNGPGAGNADLFIYKYTVAGTTWAALAGTTAGKVIDGQGSTGQESPYWCLPVFSSDWDGAGTGWMYLAWIWDAGSVVRHDLAACKWNGTDWKQMDGSAQTIPVTTGNDAVIDAAASGLSAFNTMVLDSSNRPHIFYGKPDTTNKNVYRAWHIYWNGSAWSTPDPLGSLIATGTASFAYSTLDAVIDADNTIRVVLTAPTPTTKGVYAYISNTTWTTWNLHVLTNEDVTVAEGTGTDVSVSHDRYQWSVNGKFQMLVPLTGDSGGATDSFPEDWPYYTEATVTNPSSNTTDPFFVIDGALLPNHFWANVQSDLGDVRLATGSDVPLPCYVHSYDYATKKAVIFGKWLGTLASSGSQKVRVYYGHATADTEPVTSVFGKYNCWSLGLIGFYPDGGGTDVTRYGNTLTANGAVSFGGVAGPFGSLLATDYNGTTQYGQKTSASNFSDAAPLALACWAKSDSSTADQVAVHHSDTADINDYIALQFAGSVGGDPIRALVKGITPRIAVSGTGYSAATWTHAAAINPTTTSRSALINGVAGTAETSAASPAGLDSITVGAFKHTSASNFFDGAISLAQVYQFTYPSASEMAWQVAQANQATFWGAWSSAASGGGGRGMGSKYGHTLLRP